jgi:hypothetical protein
MAGGIPFSQALQIIGGVPLQKVGSVFAEKLSITKRLDGGAVGDLMKKVIADGNLSSILQNPQAAITNAISGQLGGLASQLGSIPGASGLISSLTGSTGLGSVLSTFQAAGNTLAGLTGDGSGFFTMLAHDATAQMAGEAMPASALTSVVTAPLTASGLLGSIQTVLPQIVGQVVAGTLDPTTAQAWVDGVAAQLSGIVTASNDALAWSAANHVRIAAVATIGGALAVPPVFDSAGNRQEGAATGFQGVLQSLVQPSAVGPLSDALNALTAAKRYDPVDPDDYTSLEG